jgi:fructokinase
LEPPRIGIDLGGTKIEIVVLDPDGAELFRKRIPTPRAYGSSLEAIRGLVAEADAHTGARGTVGLGIPGTISPLSSLVKNANSTWLIGRPLDRDLAETLERPVRIANDANCFTLSEAVDGAGSEGDVVFGVIIGTGVGGGISVDRTILEGHQRIAGEWGHNPLPWPGKGEAPGPECYCGRRGCVETFLSGPGFSGDHRRATGRDWDPPRIVSAAAGGDQGAEAALDRYAHRLARSLAVVINILDPDVIVLGGGMSNLPDLPGRTQRHLGDFVFTDRVTTPIVVNLHGDSSGVRGAAWLWDPPARPPVDGGEASGTGSSLGG